MKCPPFVLIQAATLSSTVVTSFPPSSATTLPTSDFFFDVLPMTTNCIPCSGFAPPLAAAAALPSTPPAEPADADGTDGALTFGRMRSRFTYLYFLLESQQNTTLLVSLYVSANYCRLGRVFKSSLLVTVEADWQWTRTTCIMKHTEGERDIWWTHGQMWKKTHMT